MFFNRLCVIFRVIVIQMYFLFPFVDALLITMMILKSNAFFEVILSATIANDSYAHFVLLRAEDDPVFLCPH